MAAGSLVFTVHMLVLGWNFNLALLGKVTELKAFNEHVVNETGLQIYCRKGDEKLIVYAWKSVYIDLVDMPSDSELFVGENVSEVQAKHADFLSAWFFWSRRQQYISLPVFDNYCIGVICKNPCKFKLCERSVNYWKLLQLSIGIFLFFYATALSRYFFNQVRLEASIWMKSGVVFLYLCCSFPDVNFTILFYVYAQHPASLLKLGPFNVSHTCASLAITVKNCNDILRNIILYYVTGITFGVVSSFLVVIFLISRITPRKLGAYTVIVFGWSMVLYFLQLAWDNMKSLLESYSNFVYGYIIATSLISFALCYRYGPFTDYRTLKLIQWTLQLFALLIIFLSSEFQEVPTVIIIIMLAVHLFPEQWTVYAQKLWRRYFPPKIKLLTEAEYIQEASVETRKALEELRSFCQSPNCNTWKIVSEIKDPLRFSKFVLGESHLSDQEMLDYDCDMGSLPSLENGSNIHDDEDIDNSNDSDLMDGNNIYMNSTQHTHTSLLCIL